MNKLLQIKPGKLLLLHLTIIALTIVISILWSNLVPEPLAMFGIAFVLIGFWGGYLFWIYSILTAFNNLDLKYGLKNNLKKFKILLPSVIVVYVAWVLLFLYESPKEKENILFVISNLSSFYLIYAFIDVSIVITKKYRYYEDKPHPNLWNYFVTLLTLGFYPFGILMLHSHLQLILRDQKIIECNRQ